MPKINPITCSYIFVGLLTCCMIGVTVFEMFRTWDFIIPKFSDVIKHPPGAYLWELANHLFMPFWYLCLFLVYLFLSWQIQQQTIANGGTVYKFCFLPLNWWNKFLLLIMLWGAYHFAACSVIPFGRTDEYYRKLAGIKNQYEFGLHRSFCHTSFFLSSFGELGWIVLRYLSKKRNITTTPSPSPPLLNLSTKNSIGGKIFGILFEEIQNLFYDQLGRLTLLSTAIGSALLFKCLPESQFGRISEYAGILCLVWFSSTWIQEFKHCYVKARLIRPQQKETIWNTEEETNNNSSSSSGVASARAIVVSASAFVASARIIEEGGGLKKQKKRKIRKEQERGKEKEQESESESEEENDDVVSDNPSASSSFPLSFPASAPASASVAFSRSSNFLIPEHWKPWILFAILLILFYSYWYYLFLM